ncbi:hypothetical protein D9M71_694320 [compost metagenome]
MEGDADGAGGRDQLAAQRGVNVAVRVQRADHHAVATQLPALRDVTQHDVGFQGVVTEVTRARADQHEQRNPQPIPRHCDAAVGGCGAALGQVVEELDAIRTALLRRQGRCNGVRRYLEGAPLHAQVCSLVYTEAESRRSSWRSLSHTA